MNFYAPGEIVVRAARALLCCSKSSGDATASRPTAGKSFPGKVVTESSTSDKLTVAPEVVVSANRRLPDMKPTATPAVEHIFNRYSAFLEDPFTSSQSRTPTALTSNTFIDY